jgi:hypothetical protein
VRFKYLGSGEKDIARSAILTGTQNHTQIEPVAGWFCWLQSKQNIAISTIKFFIKNALRMIAIGGV